MVIDFLDQIRNKGWQSVEAKTSEERERSCWVSPDGKWYNVPHAEHATFAKFVADDLYPELKKSKFLGIAFDEAGKILADKGWVLVFHNIYDGTIMRGYQKMNMKQYKVLQEFFGNERLFRGWTIRALWERARSV